MSAELCMAEVVEYRKNTELCSQSLEQIRRMGSTSKARAMLLIVTDGRRVQGCYGQCQRRCLYGQQARGVQEGLLEKGRGERVCEYTNVCFYDEWV